MKFVLVIFAVVSVCVNAVEDRNVVQKWTNFQEKFGKTYRSPLEVRRRFTIFQNNLDIIETHNNLFKEGHTTYTMKINQFADWTQNEFEKYVNKGLVNKTKTLKSNKVFVKTAGFVAPESVDWRQEGVVTPVKDQGSCGSCWAFSSTGAIEGLMGITKKKLVSLSEQCLIDCSNNGGNMGCGGGLMTSAFDYVKDNGIATEEDYPYLGRNGNCKANQFQSVTTLSGYIDIPEGDEESLIEAITKGPVSVGVDASFSFQFYSSGIFTGFCSTTYLNHGILAVGYGKEDGKEFYIVKNSWGESWGEKGYIRLPKNSSNKCGIASMATYPQL